MLSLLRTLSRSQHLYLFGRRAESLALGLRKLLEEALGLSETELFSRADGDGLWLSWEGLGGKLQRVGELGEGEEEALRCKLLTALIPWTREAKASLYFPSSDALRPITHVAFDLDGTLTTAELLPELARRLGRSDEMVRLTDQAMRGLVPFTESFLHRTRLLEGLGREAFDEVVRSIPIPESVRLLHELDLPRAIVTGAYLPFVTASAERLGVTDYIGSPVRWTEAGRFAGLLPEAIVSAEGKRTFLTGWTGGALRSTLYVGDGANDIPALAAAGHALLYQATESAGCTTPSLRTLVLRILRGSEAPTPS